jgi:hypothetical protein
MLGDTLVLPLVGGSITLKKKQESGGTSLYGLITSTTETTAQVRHSTVKAADGRTYHRHNFEVKRVTFAVGDVPESYHKFYFVMENLPGDLSFDIEDAVADLMIASSNAFVSSMIQNEV